MADAGKDSVLNWLDRYLDKLDISECSRPNKVILQYLKKRLKQCEMLTITFGK